MRATTLLKKVLAIKFTRVTGIAFTEDGLVCDVAPTTSAPRCGACCRKVRHVHDRRERTWRHLDLGGMKTELRYAIRRVSCPRCGVTTELVPWARHASGFTDAFERTTAFLAQVCAKTAVVEMMRVGWRTVGAIIRRVVEREGPEDRLAGLTHIGIDELSYRKHHEYVTIVVDHVTGNIVWAHPGRNADTLRKFFVELGQQRCALLKAVTIDMSASYRAAVEEYAVNAEIIFDRFHVQRLAHDALDEVRRAEVRAIEAPEERRALKHSRFALQKNPWNLTDIEQMKLVEVQRTNRTLYRAYLLKESLAAILDRRQRYVAEEKLREWISWATHSGIAPFARVARTIAAHFDGILAYVASGLSNGRSEGTNGKARAITRRSFGFHTAWSLIAMLFLCCAGLHLTPARTFPSFH
ncbi:MAG TPA: ISL3 family transposase [Polyangiaceae bacterium]|nr:ISL3 family transposase [Polyangiaceae bacterium]